MNTLLAVLVALGRNGVHACTVLVIDPMFKINTTAGALGNPWPLTRPLAAAPGEQVHLQAVLTGVPADSTASVTATVDGLGPMSTRKLMYSELNETFAAAHAPGLYPDALVPPDDEEDHVFHLSDGGAAVHVFWLTLEVDRSAPAGDHSGGIQVNFSSHTAAASCLTSFVVRTTKWSLPESPSQLTDAQFISKGILPFGGDGATVAPETAMNWFEALARQRINAFPYPYFDTLSFSPTYRFDEARATVTLNTSEHQVWWPKVLALTGAKHWHMPFMRQLHSSVSHYLPDNSTWTFFDHEGKKFVIPVYGAPAGPMNATINPEFRRLFLVLVRATVSYLEANGWADSGCWVQVTDEPTYQDNATLRNMVAMMRLYREASPHIKIYQTRFPCGTIHPCGSSGGGGGDDGDDLPPGLQRYASLLEQIDWWCPQVCQWEGAGVPEVLAKLRRQRASAGREFHVTAYDNGVPLIESARERLRTQGLDVWRSNGTLSGTLSWYSVNSYGVHFDKATNKSTADPWHSVYPSTSKDPAGFGFLLWPPPPSRRGPAVWHPIESVRWVMLGAGLSDAEYLYALQRLGSLSVEAESLMNQARTMATAFPTKWNRRMGVKPLFWGADGYTVDPGNETDGSSVVNEWRLRMGAELDRLTTGTGPGV
jgi:hypothetical protein